MKKLKLSGRELSVLRAIDFAMGSTGEELLVRTRLDHDELTDILNSFLGMGYIETIPNRDSVPYDELKASKFEVNPGYAKELSAAIRWRF